MTDYLSIAVFTEVFASAPSAYKTGYFPPTGPLIGAPAELADDAKAKKLPASWTGSMVPLMGQVLGMSEPRGLLQRSQYDRSLKLPAPPDLSRWGELEAEVSVLGPAAQDGPRRAGADPRRPSGWALHRVAGQGHQEQPARRVLPPEVEEQRRSLRTKAVQKAGNEISGSIRAMARGGWKVNA